MAENIRLTIVPERIHLIVDTEHIDLHRMLPTLLNLGASQPGQPGRDDGVEFGEIEIDGDLQAEIDGQQIGRDQAIDMLRDGLIIILRKAAEAFDETQK